MVAFDMNLWCIQVKKNVSTTRVGIEKDLQSQKAERNFSPFIHKFSVLLFRDNTLFWIWRWVKSEIYRSKSQMKFNVSTRSAYYKKKMKESKSLEKENYVSEKKIFVIESSR